MVVASRRLPGIEVGVAPRPAVEALPRMDVALLVGFASTGPVHTPVPIESVARFTEVFGADAPLAWDVTRGERVFAYLGPAVRAFFGNGGRRCWVVRAARAPLTNEFDIPGVLSIAADGSAGVATAIARAAGSWSDPLRVATALQKRTFAIDAVTPLSSPASHGFAFRTRFGVRAGDLMELDSEAGTVYATVDVVRAAREANGPYAVEATVCAAFDRVFAASPPVSPLAGQTGDVALHGFGDPVAGTLLVPAAAADPARLVLTTPVPAGVEPGRWARWSDGAETVWLRIDEIDRGSAAVASPPVFDSPAGAAELRGAAWRERHGTLPDLAGLRRAHLVSIDLRVTVADDQVARLNAIGLTRAHPDAWWNRLTDADFYRPGDDGISASDRARDEGPRFPLARSSDPVPRAWVPLGATPLFGSPLPPRPPSLTALERDGLAEFDAALFLDPELADAEVRRIPELAEAIRFIREDRRPLRGLHAGWSIGAGGLFNEVSLLAIPDAIHLGWHRRPDEEIPEPTPNDPAAPPHWHTHRGPCAKAVDTPADAPDFGTFLDCSTEAIVAPILQGPPSPVPPGVYRLSWTHAGPSDSYVLYEFTQPDLSDPREIYSGTDAEFMALGSREGIYYYQVIARRGDDRSDGSNIVAVLVRADDWVQNRPTREVDEALEREWLAIHRAALRMAAASGDLFAALALPRHFRSERAIRYVQRLRTVRNPPGPADLQALGFSEGRALSYGAMYFPWLQSEVRPGGLVRDTRVRPPKIVPPDGVALGVLAARASNRGAWIAPANEPMRDVVAVTPAIPPADWQALLDAQINLVRSDPRGFMTLSADTLAHEVELRPINVRRLLSLLRRLALRRGITYVFEPNGPALRRSVQRGFDLLLGDLFRRGAFAGASESQSFRVVTDSTINTPQDEYAGRFFVELRVAPSLPMRFVSIRLAQTGARLTVTEEL